MIVRPRLHWLLMLFVWRGSVLGRILPQLFLTTSLAFAVVLWQHARPAQMLDLTPVPFTLLGIALAIFLGFRNSVSYDRYWEARKLWGAMLNDTRSLTRQLGSLADIDQGTRSQLVHALIAFVHALRCQLRKCPSESELKRLLPDDWADQVGRRRFQPSAILMLLAEALRDLRLDRKISPVLMAAMDRHLSQLNEAMGGCERIESTPIPFAYSVILHRTIYLYSFLLPFGLVSTVGFMTPLVVAFISYTFFALEALAEEIQEPFGLEPNDLALDSMSAMIEATLREMIGETPPQADPVPANHVLT